MTQPENPPAFPRPFFEGPRGDWSSAQDGMTLRDHFAGQCLAGYLPGKGVMDYDVEDRVAAAYRVADAMLAERAKGETP